MRGIRSAGRKRIKKRGGNSERIMKHRKIQEISTSSEKPGENCGVPYMAELSVQPGSERAGWRAVGVAVEVEGRHPVRRQQLVHLAQERLGQQPPRHRAPCAHATLAMMPSCAFIRKFTQLNSNASCTVKT